MYRINSKGKAILYLTAFVWVSCILIMGSALLNSLDKNQGAPKGQGISIAADAEEPRAIPVLEKANIPFDMPVLNFERTAAYKVDVFPDERVAYTSVGMKALLVYHYVLTKTGKPGITTERYYKGVGYG